MKEHVTETKIGNTVFTLTSKCSEHAGETLAQKLERLICRRASDTKSYQVNSGTSLAISKTMREHGADIIRKE